MERIFGVTVSMAKCIPVSTNTVQVNELAGCDPGEVDQAFSDRVHQSDDRLIVAHHSVALRSLEAKIVGTSRSILRVLGSGSEIVPCPSGCGKISVYRFSPTM